MKKPAILLIVLVALVGFALFYKRAFDERTSGYSLSKADAREFLLPNLPSDKVHKVTVHDSKGKVSLAVVGGQWVVEDRSNYPASLEKIQRAVQGLEELKIKDRKEVGKSSLAKLNVLAPGEQKDGEGAGLEVKLEDEKGTLLGSVVVGSSPKSSGGASSTNMFGGPTPQRFVRTPNDKDTVWVVDDSFDELLSDPRLWLNMAWPNITNVKSAEVNFPNAADSWKAERATLDAPFTFVNAPAGEELDTAKAAGLAARVLEGPLNDVLLKDKVTPDTMKGASKVKIVTFEGFTYDVEILAKKDAEEGFPAYLVTMKVTADLPKVRKPSPDEKEADVKQKDEEFKQRNELLTKRLADEQKQFHGWVYEVSQYGVSSLVKKRSELLREKAPAPQAPVPGALMPPNAAPVPPLGIPGTAPVRSAPPAALAPAPAPAAEKPVESKPAAPAPADKPAETKPAAPAPAEKPATPAPADKPAETKPAAPAPAEKPATPAPADKPAETKPAETKPASS
ncbi:uncharacterized protein DUF4340 [Roseimicrobium gellanilyticum]|uniref:Uncharacterized protein DUF4340 n=1 Tax=Roseimicrobium gellanilyticum TaxID=748857 RepID=A0A366H1T2_9BACT|nr:DUF4340 domain-containing protein [Roseimicrobium gellanilyticum]RBP35851.1 uncharacterized protein DUF4340 [Roseimicrobium gellanilyticum]